MTATYINYLGRLLLFIAIPCAAPAQSAEPPPPPPNEDLFGEEDGMPPPPPACSENPAACPFPPPPEQGKRFTDRWLDTLRAENPEQYQKYAALRDEDPEAFRECLSAELARKKMTDCLKSCPAVYASFMELPDEEQIRLATACLAHPHGRDPHRRHGPDDPDSPRRNHKAHDIKAFREMIQQYNQTEDPAAKETLRLQILEQIGKRFDERIEERRTHLQQLTRQLTAFQEKLDQQVKNRDTLVQERFDRLTSRNKAE